MAKTYVPADLQTSTKDQLRLATGDNVEDSMVLDDAEIAFIVSRNTNDVGVVNLRGAALGTLDAIILQFAKEVSYSKKSISESANQRYDQFAKERDRIANGGALFTGGDVVPISFYFGGVLRAENEKMAADPSLRQPTFYKHSDDHPGNASDLSDNFLDDPFN